MTRRQWTTIARTLRETPYSTIAGDFAAAAERENLAFAFARMIENAPDASPTFDRAEFLRLADRDLKLRTLATLKV